MKNFIFDFFDNKKSQQYKTHLVDLSSEIRKKITYFENFNDDVLLNNFQLAKDSLDDKTQLIDVFAITSVFIDRLLNIKLFDVQLQGAIALYEGNIAEMKTGEGKTITSVLPIVLNAIKHHYVHVVTVNEYLVQRDKNLLQPVFEKLNLSVAVNLHDDSPQKKKQNYKANILYSTATELGFDFLRDNMVSNYSDKYCPQGRIVAIIDEIDMVLIDESRTPLIIGKQEDESVANVLNAHLFIKSLNNDDFVLNFNDKTVFLSPSGVDKANKYFETTNIFTYPDKMFKIHQALVANFLYNENVDYVVKNDEVIIVDKFTGRLSDGRRFSNGLHQALEAKHNVTIKTENKTIATITLQNYFRLYSKLSGMTGTASEEKQELFSVYGLEIAKIDTNKPYNRLDFPIVLLPSKKDKFKKIIERTLHYHNQNQPVLIGTISIDDSIAISNELNNLNLKHEVLNANQDEKEASIIKKAGKSNAITIATNMAGRGTDIVVDDNHFLTVIVSELNDSPRIDNQLKGRTARQGDKGITETIISLEDDFFKKLPNNLSLILPTSDSTLNKLHENIILDYQSEIVYKNEVNRKHQLKFDEVIGKQRSVFYVDRDIVLSSKKPLDLILSLTKSPALVSKIKELYSSEEHQNQLAKEILLFAFDYCWVEHLNNLSLLKDGISFRTNNNSPIIVSFAIEAEKLFNQFKKNITNKIIDVIDNLKLVNDFEKVYENASVNYD